MKKIAFIIAALMMFSTAVDAKGFRIPRFKSPTFSSKTVRPSVKPKPVPKTAPKQNVETRTYRSTPVRDRDDGGDTVSSFLSGAAGGIVGGVIYDGITSEEQPEPIIQPIEKIEK